MKDNNLIKFFESKGYIFFNKYRRHKIFYLLNNDVLIRLTIEKTYPKGYLLSIYPKSLYQNIEDCYYEINFETNWDRYYHETIFNNYDEVIDFFNKERMFKLENIDTPEKLISLIDYIYEIRHKKYGFLEKIGKCDFITSDIKVVLNLLLKKYDLVKEALYKRIKWNELTIDKIEEGHINKHPYFKTLNLNGDLIIEKLLKEIEEFKYFIELIDTCQEKKIQNHLEIIKKDNLIKFKERLNIEL